MTAEPTPIEGCLVFEFHRMSDDRGSFARAFDAGEFHAAGVEFAVVQANLAVSELAGTVRGLHYQLAPYGEQKLLRCTRGSVFDVVVDLRAGSPSYMSWFGIELSPGNGLAVLAPRGCAHGYMCLEPRSEVVYFSDAAYAPRAERVLAAANERIDVHWPQPIAVQSPKDAAASPVADPEPSGY